jgi:hypothetical protein
VYICIKAIQYRIPTVLILIWNYPVPRNARALVIIRQLEAVSSHGHRKRMPCVNYQAWYKSGAAMPSIQIDE